MISDLAAVSEAFEAGQLQIADSLDAISKHCAVTEDLLLPAYKFPIAPIQAELRHRVLKDEKCRSSSEPAGSMAWENLISPMA